MTHFQEMFVKNLRFFRKRRGMSQLKLSELVEVSPNYLNAVENGNNFPSPEVVQRMTDALGILPYQLFLEYQAEASGAVQGEKAMIIHELAQGRQKILRDLDEIIEKYAQ
jgi:transcriptional regulator with XRE-family HTH domain